MKAQSSVTKAPKGKLARRVKMYFGGVTGSNPAPSARVRPPEKSGSTQFLTQPLHRGEFGSNTTSIAMIIGHTAVLIDNGTGVVEAAEFILSQRPKRVYMLQTHNHFDHVSGLTSNPLFFKKKDEIGYVDQIWAPNQGAPRFSQTIKTLFELWPVRPDMAEVSRRIDQFDSGREIHVPHLPGFVKTLALNHPGGAAAYRIPTHLGDIVIATDNELSNNPSGSVSDYAQFIDGARILYADVQYSDEEYRGDKAIGGGNTRIIRKNWGHSTPYMLLSALQLAKNPPHVIVGHHDPKRDSMGLKAFEGDARELFEQCGFNLSFARENSQVIDLRPGHI